MLLPFQASALSLRSIAQALRVVEHVKGSENQALSLLGILPTMAERDAEPSQEILVDIWTGFAGVLDTVIPRSDVFARASHQGLPVGFLAGPLAAEARRFSTLAAEVEGLIETMSTNEARFRVRHGEGRTMTVGVLGPRVVSRDTRDALEQCSRGLERHGPRP